MTNILHEGSFRAAAYTITQGLVFILSHVDGLWPKMASTYLTANAQMAVNGPEEAIRRYTQAKLLDSKISAYDNYTGDFKKGAHDSKIFGGRGITPSLLFIDLDRGGFNSNIDLLNQALFRPLLRHVFAMLT